MKSLPPSSGPRSRFKGIPLGVFGLLLAAVAVILYLLVRQVGQEARARRLQDQVQALELERRENAALRDRGAEEARLALARIQQDTLLTRARSLAGGLEGLLTQVSDLRQQGDRFAVSDDGRRVGLHPEIFARARIFYERDLAELPSREEVALQLESARRVIEEVAGKVGTTFEPPPALTAATDDARLWYEAAARRVRDAKTTLDMLAREARIRVAPAGAPATPPTLQEAIRIAQSRDAQDRTATIAARVEEVRQQAVVQEAEAAARKAQVEAETKAREDLLAARRMEEEADRKRQQEEERLAGEKKIREAKQQQERLVAEAQSAEIKQLLAPFITPGRWRPTRDFTAKVTAGPDPKPMSFRDISNLGCLEQTQGGLGRLYRVASDPSDQIRPRWSWSQHVTWMKDKQTLEMVNKAQQTLIRLGPTLVELKMLEP